MKSDILVMDVEVIERSKAECLREKKDNWAESRGQGIHLPVPLSPSSSEFSKEAENVAV